MGKTKIEWTDYTFNPWWGCTKVSEGCANCYAERLAHRFDKNLWGPGSSRRGFGDEHWTEPRFWNRKAQREGVRRRVFCGSMCDVFESHLDVKYHRMQLWRLIEETPALDWLLLTKRPENIERMLPQRWSSFGYFELHKRLADGPTMPNNLWLGISAEDQKCFEAR